MPNFQWYLPTLAELMQVAEPSTSETTVVDGSNDFSPRHSSNSRAQREWYSAITSLNVLLDRLLKNTLLITPDNLSSPVEGLVISGPLPVLGSIRLVQQFSSWVLTGGVGQPHFPNPFQLLPAAEIAASAESSTVSLPLLPDDPLGAEPFCLVLTPEFSLMMTLNAVSGSGTESDRFPQGEQFLFSFTPEVVWQGWRSLRSRLELTTPHITSQLDLLVEQFAPITPDYRLVAEFSRLMLNHFPDSAGNNSENIRKFSVQTYQPPITSQTKQDKRSFNLNSPESTPKAKKQKVSLYSISCGENDESNSKTDKLHRDSSSQALDMAPEMQQTGFDTDLLRAIAHEVKTPLTTIRTLTRLILRRKSLPDGIIRNLKMIDAECTRQIDRFGLIFRAVELQDKPENPNLSSMAKVSLLNILQQNSPQWKQQAEQRDLTLHVLMPKTLPYVFSDPSMLEQMLSGLIDQLTHVLPCKSQIEIIVATAGSQIKLQFCSNIPARIDLLKNPSSSNVLNHSSFEQNDTTSVFSSSLQSVGELLMVQPETGNLSLNLDVTKRLFHALGGKFTIRQHSQQGEVLTIFLPSDNGGYKS